MSRNGAGTYVLPAGQPVVTGTTISSTVHNTFANDIANALTTSIATDGQSVVTANIPFAGYKLTGIGAATVNGDAVRYQDVGSFQQSQTFVAFTTGGTTTAYTLTPTPAITSLVANQRFRVKFNAANTSTTPTLAVSGLAATALKVYDAAGVKTNPWAGQFATNFLCDVEYDGTDFVALLPMRGAVVIEAAQATTSGTFKDSGAIPPWATEIDINLNGVSTNGSSAFVAVIGDSGGLEVAGYLSGGGALIGGTSTNYIAAFGIGNGLTAARAHSGTVTLKLMNRASNTWTIGGQITRDNDGQIYFAAGAKSLSGVLTTVRFTMANGTDVFDAGEVSFSYR